MKLARDFVIGSWLFLIAGVLSAQSDAAPDTGLSSWFQKKTLFSWKTGENGADKDEADEEDEIVTDRPDFTESSTNVGKGRVQLEMGYTYSQNRDQGVQNAHSYPEILLRVGMFADWFELRIGQNMSNSRAFGADGGAFNTIGGEDMYLGIGLALTEQAGILPESRLIVQATVPTGSDSLSANRMLPGLNYTYSWVLNDFLSLAGSTQGNASVDADGFNYVEYAQSLSVGYSLTEKLGAFTEFFAFFPHGAQAADTTAEYYFNGGFTYRFTPTFQFDIRSGVGLNRHAEDFFLGSGFAIKF